MKATLLSFSAWNVSNNVLSFWQSAIHFQFSFYTACTPCTACTASHLLHGTISRAFLSTSLIFLFLQRTWWILDDKTATESKTLIGHSGPVYGASFNYDNSLLLTSSEDKTGVLFSLFFSWLLYSKVDYHYSQCQSLFLFLVRLWSLFTYTNIVCYKGHNYPVWDVQFW